MTYSHIYSAYIFFFGQHLYENISHLVLNRLTFCHEPIFIIKDVDHKVERLLVLRNYGRNKDTNNRSCSHSSSWFIFR